MYRTPSRVPTVSYRSHAPCVPYLKRGPCRDPYAACHTMRSIRSLSHYAKKHHASQHQYRKCSMRMTRMMVIFAVDAMFSVLHLNLVACKASCLAVAQALLSTACLSSQQVAGSDVHQLPGSLRGLNLTGCLNSLNLSAGIANRSGNSQEKKDKFTPAALGRGRPWIDQSSRPLKRGLVQEVLNSYSSCACILFDVDNSPAVAA